MINNFDGQFYRLKKIIDLIASQIYRGPFLTTPFSVIINPVYIARSGLHNNLKRYAGTISGDILDIGCGTKPYLSLFYNANSYIGVDVLISGHDHKDSNVDVFYDGNSLPFPDNYFDAVVSFQVFEHIQNLDDIITDIYRVIKPGGKLLVSIPFVWEEHEIPYDYIRFTSFGAKIILEKQGFEILVSNKTTSYVLTIGQMWITLLTEWLTFKNKFFRILFQLCVIFPFTVIFLLLDVVLPKRFGFYCDNVVLATKPT